MPRVSSSITPEQTAVALHGVCKSYRLYGSRKDQLLDLFGLTRLGFKTSTPATEYHALTDVSFHLGRGERLGIIGRNGAGKTTLLKLICGILSPTSGSLRVNGEVQALLSVGLGFHPEYTGRQNVEAALQHNGVAHKEFQATLQDVIAFAELDHFIDQPFRTYSLGMQARLMFAAATAIKPEILIVDEVLGAGDAYFAIKCKRRVESLVGSGCSLLLVSHSTSQILEFCSRVIWLERGQIRMEGDALSVVKAYEESIHGAAQPSPTAPEPGPRPTSRAEPTVVIALPDPRSGKLQEPGFLPHGRPVELMEVCPAGFPFLTPDGLSRWEGAEGVRVVGFTMVTEQGESNQLIAMRAARFVLTLEAELSNKFRCRYGIIFHDLAGDVRARIFSPVDCFEARRGQRRQVEILLNPCQLGPGDYIGGVSVHDDTPLEQINSSLRYDLVARSFPVRVGLPDSQLPLAAAFFHSAEWLFREAESND